MYEVPMEHKARIQSSFARYRELTPLGSELSNQVSQGNFFFWAGIVIFLAWLGSMVAGKYFTDMPAGIAFSAFCIGWFLRSSASSKQQKIRAQIANVESEMKEIGVTFSEFNGKFSAYYQKITPDCEFNPMNDAPYTEYRDTYTPTRL